MFDVNKGRGSYELLKKVRTRHVRTEIPSLSTVGKVRVLINRGDCWFQHNFMLLTFNVNTEMEEVLSFMISEFSSNST